MSIETVLGHTVRIFGPSDPEDSAAGHRQSAPVLWLIHGAGMSSSSFVPLASLLSSAAFAGAAASSPGQPAVVPPRCAAIDLRCHGDSTQEGGEASLTLDQLSTDVVAVILEASSKWFPSQPRLFLAGHSLGGSVAVRVGHSPQLKSRLAGLVLLDIVEDTARLSLQHMKAFLEARPTSFRSADAAVSWFLSKGGMRNEQSARITVPHLLRRSAPDEWAWRTDLAATMPCWDGWFVELNTLFLTLPCPKMLMLAGTDRLDKALTIGHMQGKFQLEVVGGGVGHYLHEDDPNTVALKILRFVVRVDTLLRKLPPLR